MTSQTIGVAKTDVEAGQDVDVDLGSPDEPDYAGWFCVKTDPWPCAAAGCDFIAEFITAAHHIIVWAERDDPRLLKHAGYAKQYRRNPRVVEYEPSMGPCLAYDAWYAMGRPVHAVGKAPDAA